MTAPDACFHCALPIPANCDFTVEIDGAAQTVCCPGCKAVAELIRDSGFAGYYSMREVPEPGIGRPLEDEDEWRVFDRDDMLAAFAEQSGDLAESTIYVGGMYCAACSWLIESTLAKLAGIDTTDVNPVTHRLRVRWKTDTVGLGRILATLASLGYKPQPLAPDSTIRPELVEQRTALKRLLVASLGMMQAMMFAVALYSGQFQGIDAQMERFLRLVSFVVTTPVVFYSARPFFAGAIRGIRARQPGMDLPVSIAVGTAYVASVYATYTNGPQVWYDSVTMFVFFLTVGRYLEMRARHRSIDRSAAMSGLLPNTVTRLEDGQATIVPAGQLVQGDRILIRAGEAIPADGSLVEGSTTVDESVLTGEARPVTKSVGDALVAGAVNLDGVVEMIVDKTGVDTTLGTLSRLSERARYARPAFVQLADRIASYIVIAILVVSVGVAVAWSMIDAERAFEITLSVLVVTCPCALALATPAAFAAAGSRLADLRLLLTNGNAIEVLARAQHVMFDKTGTLTRGMPGITGTEVLDRDYDEADVTRIAAALEVSSTHPIARAFAIDAQLDAATDIHTEVGAGIAGNINGRRWKLGSFEFVAPDADVPKATETTRVWLGTDDRVVAAFDIDDELRPDAHSTIDTLKTSGLDISLVSGDSHRPVERTATELGIEAWRAASSPQDKLDGIRRLQRGGKSVVMVGDGINDAPVLAGADASVAPAHAASLAQTNADMIMLGDSLKPLLTGFGLARATMRIVRQNIAWAIVYNAAALPLAALGYVPPWAAAIGMSASSLIVVLNALRLSRHE